MKQITYIGVVGAGQMGCGIAQTAASAGFNVLITDRDLNTARSGVEMIEKRLSNQVTREKISEKQRQEVTSRIEAVGNIHALADCPLVIEAATENQSLKLELFRQLDQTCQPATILASNTSSISITSIAAATERPEKVIGMHFFNPVPAMALVEVIKGLATSSATFEAVHEFAEQMGKTPVVSHDKAGFIVNRLLIPMLNEACFALEEGVASIEDIDSAMQLGCGHPMGPLTLADFIGLDTCLAIMEVLHTELGEDKYRPSPLLRQYVTAGWLGRKAGRGFYRYNS
ncbi:MAG: 3-hydroxybutyryl-CoA dehydrogenase [Marinobacterium sp.]|nr:3-hydroxybutyryl-CoA dehydrogenase [Marinobacterium sp.]